MLKTSYTLSLILATMMIGSAISVVKEHKIAEAQVVESTTNVPFTGKLTNVQLCCNGVQFSLSHPPLSIPQTSSGNFIFMWQNMIPIPAIGWGLYSWWSLAPSETLLGSVTPGGVCITIASECESSQTVQFMVNQAGTTLIPSMI